MEVGDFQGLQVFIGTDLLKKHLDSSAPSGQTVHMRISRILSPGTARYHVMSRVVDGRYIFDGLEKFEFRRIMRGGKRVRGQEKELGASSIRLSPALF